MKIKHLVAASAAALLVACSEAPAPETEEAAEPVAASNPILEEWDTPLGVPPFDRIE